MPHIPAEKLELLRTPCESENFRPLGVLTVDEQNIAHLQANVQAEIRELYANINSGIKHFNEFYFRSETGEFVAVANDRSALKKKLEDLKSSSVVELRKQIGRVAPVADASSQILIRLQFCDVHQRKENWNRYEEAIRKNNKITDSERELRLKKLRELQTQWFEHTAFAHYQTSELLNLVQFIEGTPGLEDSLNDHLKYERYLPTSAKFFFDDVRAIKDELNKIRHQIRLEMYHRLRVAKKNQDKQYRDTLAELNSELMKLGFPSQGNVEGNEEAVNRRRDLTAEAELQFRAYIDKGTSEVKARVSNLLTYGALAQKLAIDVHNFEENIFPLPGIRFHGSASDPVTLHRPTEFALKENELKLPEENTGWKWWNRWSICRRNLFRNKDFIEFNRHVENIRKVGVTPVSPDMLPNLASDDANYQTRKEELNAAYKSNLWIIANAHRLLHSLSPSDNQSSLVPSSWASFSWLPGTESYKTHKILNAWRNILTKAKEGSVKYPVPEGLQGFIPFDPKEKDSQQSIRHGLFFPTTLLNDFNHLAFSIGEDFDQRLRALTRLNHTDIEQELHLNDFFALEDVINKIKKQIEENKPNAFTAFFSSQRSQTRDMLTLWQQKIDEAYAKFAIQKKAVAKFIVNNINKYIDETDVSQIDLDLVQNRLKKFVDTYGTAEDKKNYSNNITPAYIFQRKVNDDSFIDKARGATINNTAVDRMVILAKRLQPNQAMLFDDLAEIIKGKKYSISEERETKEYGIFGAIRREIVQIPATKDNLSKKFAAVCNDTRVIADITNKLWNNVIKTTWNPFASHADESARSFCTNEAEFTRLKNDQNQIHRDLHQLLILFLHSDVYHNHDISRASRNQYRANNVSQKAYFPSEVYQYIEHSRPDVDKNKQSNWENTKSTALQHASSVQGVGQFRGKNTYAGELISCLGEEESVCIYASRRMLHLLDEQSRKFDEHSIEPEKDSFVLPELDTKFFFEKHPATISKSYITKLLEYVNNDRVYVGQSRQLAKFIKQVYDAAAAQRLNLRDADELVKIWGIKRFIYLSKYNPLELSEEDNVFFWQFLNNNKQNDKNPLTKELLIQMKQWLPDDLNRGFRGNHDVFWKIITILGDEDLIKRYAIRRIRYLLSNAEKLSDSDWEFLKHNAHVVGLNDEIRKQVLLPYLYAEDGYKGDHLYHLNLFKYSNSKSVKHAFISKRLKFLFATDTDITKEDCDFLDDNTKSEEFRNAVQLRMRFYANEIYKGDNHKFIALLLGLYSYDINKPKEALAHPYCNPEIVTQYAVKRFAWVLKNNKAFDVVDIDYLRKEPVLSAIRKGVVNSILNLFDGNKYNFWFSTPEENNRCKQYTQFISELIATKEGTTRTGEQVQLMSEYSSRRLVQLFNIDQAFDSEKEFFEACSSESSVRKILSHIVVEASHTIRKSDKHADFILKLDTNAVATYFSERADYLLIQPIDAKTILLSLPKADFNRFLTAIQKEPLINELNENFKTIIKNKFNALFKTSPANLAKDKRIIDLLTILISRENNFDFVAEKIANVLDHCLNNKIAVPEIYRDFCRDNAQNTVLRKALDEVLVKHLTKNELLVKYDNNINNYILSPFLIESKKDIDWHKVIADFASDETYDNCYVPVFNYYLRFSNLSLDELVHFKNKMRANVADSCVIDRSPRPASTNGINRFDKIFEYFTYHDNKSKSWNEKVQFLVESNFGSESQQDLYTLGELKRRLEDVNLSKEHFDQFFLRIDGANWGQPDIAKRERVALVKYDVNKKFLKQFIDEAMTRKWNGNVQKIIEAYGDPADQATYYRLKWFQEQMEARNNNLQRYKSEETQNYSFAQDQDNARTNLTAQTLVNHYGKYQIDLLNSALNFLNAYDPNKYDNDPRLAKFLGATAVDIIKNHFFNDNQSLRHEGWKQLENSLERYEFVLKKLLPLWQTENYEQAKVLLLEGVTSELVSMLDATKSFTNAQEQEKEQQSRAARAEQLREMFHAAKIITEEFVKAILVDSISDDIKYDKLKKISEYFMGSVTNPLGHYHDRKTNLLAEFIDAGFTKASLMAISKKCIEIYKNLEKLCVELKKLSANDDISSLERTGLFDLLTLDNAMTLSRYIPKHMLTRLSSALKAIEKRADRDDYFKAISAFINILGSATPSESDKKALEIFKIDRLLSKYRKGDDVSTQRSLSNVINANGTEAQKEKLLLIDKATQFADFLNNSYLLAVINLHKDALITQATSAGVYAENKLCVDKIDLLVSNVTEMAKIKLKDNLKSYLIKLSNLDLTTYHSLDKSIFDALPFFYALADKLGCLKDVELMDHLQFFVSKNITTLQEVNERKGSEADNVINRSKFTIDLFGSTYHRRKVRALTSELSSKAVGWVEKLQTNLITLQSYTDKLEQSIKLDFVRFFTPNSKLTQLSSDVNKDITVLIRYMADMHCDRFDKLTNPQKKIVLNHMQSKEMQAALSDPRLVKFTESDSGDFMGDLAEVYNNTGVHYLNILIESKTLNDQLTMLMEYIISGEDKKITNIQQLIQNTFELFNNFLNLLSQISTKELSGLLEKLRELQNEFIKLFRENYNISITGSSIAEASQHKTTFAPPTPQKSSSTSQLPIAHSPVTLHVSPSMPILSDSSKTDSPQSPSFFSKLFGSKTESPQKIQLQFSGDTLVALDNGYCGYNSIALQLALAAVKHQQNPKDNADILKLLKNLYSQLTSIPNNKLSKAKDFKEFYNYLVTGIQSEAGRIDIQTQLAKPLFDLAHQDFSKQTDKDNFLAVTKSEILTVFEDYAKRILSSDPEKFDKTFEEEIKQSELREIMDEQLFAVFQNQLEIVYKAIIDPNKKSVDQKQLYTEAVEKAKLQVLKYFDSNHEQYWAKRANNKWLGEYELNILGKRLGFSTTICRNTGSQWESLVTVGDANSKIKFNLARKGVHFDVLLVNYKTSSNKELRK